MFKKSNLQARWEKVAAPPAALMALGRKYKDGDLGPMYDKKDNPVKPRRGYAVARADLARIGKKGPPSAGDLLKAKTLKKQLRDDLHYSAQPQVGSFGARRGMATPSGYTRSLKIRAGEDAKKELLRRSPVAKAAKFPGKVAKGLLGALGNAGLAAKRLAGFR